MTLCTKADSGFVVAMVDSKTPEWVLIVYKPYFNLCLFRSYEMYTDIWSFKWCIVCQVQQEIFETCQEIKSRTRVYIGWKGMWIWWWTVKIIYVGIKVALLFWISYLLYLQDDDELSSNFLIQHFSPIVTSQQLMNCQFGNSYTSVQCKDGTNIVFNQVSFQQDKNKRIEMWII